MFDCRFIKCFSHPFTVFHYRLSASSVCILYNLVLCVNDYFIIVEDFITPPSSPPEPDMETENSVLPSGSKNEQDMSGDELYEHMYDR